MNNIKVLIVNTSDINGGAARAAYRLHKGLLSNAIDSQMLVQNKSSDDYTIIGPNKNVQKAIVKIRPILDLLPTRWYKNKTKTLFSPSWLPFSSIVKKINKINPDIVHLHWICAGMITIEDIARIKAPIVWSLHDNWPFTGGCHIMWECDKYKYECGSCPRLYSDKKNDLSRKIFKRKEKTFSKKQDMTIVGLSKWINECSKSSALLKDKKHVNLPNLIDTDIFKPFDKEKGRELWSLPKDKKLILFGAMSATSDINKGYKELSDTLAKMKQTDNIEFVVFGSAKPKNAPDFGFKTHYLGNLHDDITLVTLYSSVDVMIVPSLQENLANTIMESLACGTPVVGFDIGGNSDMIDHKKNGYLAKAFNISDLKNGIEWILNNHDNISYKENALNKIRNHFSSEIVSKKYIELYMSIIK